MISETARLFLDSLGRNEEYEYYIKKFRSDRSACFALLCPELPVLRDAGDVFVLQCEFLKKLALYPAILLCGPLHHQFEEFLPDSLFKKTYFHEQTCIHFAGECVREQRIPVYYFHDTVPAAIKKAQILAKRIHIIRTKGWLHTESQEALPFYYLQNPPVLVENDRSIVFILETLAGSMHLSITSPVNLLKEIFTVKGAGSIIRRGSQLLFSDHIPREDTNKIFALLEESFQKKIRDPFFLNKIKYIIYEQSYSAAALFEETEFGVYLSKFAVGVQGRGEGVGQEIWDMAVAKFPEMFWRSRKENPVNRWYQSVSHGMQRTERWHIFWRGIHPGKLGGLIPYCIEKPEDFMS